MTRPDMRVVPALRRAVLCAVALVALAATGARASGEPIGQSDFQRKVLDNDYVWIVEYMSSRCGTCREMAPVWQAFFVKHMREVKVGQVSIDHEDGMELAEDQGVLEAGVPSVWAYDRADGEGTKIWADFEVPTLDELERLVFGRFEGQRKTEDGFLAKTILEEETFE